jgi:hypothetical protein
MRGRRNHALGPARLALAATAVVIVAGATLLLAPARRPAGPPHGPGAVVLATKAPATQLTERAAPVRPPQGAVSAARAFVRDYVAALTDPVLAGRVRFATHSLRARIARAGVHLRAAGSPVLGPVVLAARGRDLVSVRATGAVAGVRQRLRFLMARTPDGWRVDDIDEPEAS